MDKGRYTIQLMNNLGQQVYQTIIEHAGGSGTQTIQLPGMLSKGIYQMHLSGGEIKTTLQLISK